MLYGIRNGTSVHDMTMESGDVISPWTCYAPFGSLITHYRYYHLFIEGKFNL